MSAKPVIIFACGLLFAAAVKPPQPPVKRAVNVYRGQPFEYVVRIITYMALIAVTAAFLYFSATTSIILSTHDSMGLLPYVCPAGIHGASATLGYSPRFVIGAACVFSGALLRLWATYTMGSLFTYEVAILKGHTLVRTGPYAFIRHPGYTGMIVVIAGVQLMHFGQGGYVSECGLAASPVWFLLYLWSILAIFVVVSLSWRTRAEDAALLKHFGPAWEDYYTQVPYALIPFLV
ncbi:hypothetical protein C8Q76DRAFT_682705 [Earliella scabrosa]|nr:hypothetical protein C8Q76DRAFT_682705 [Earliella scabrosa]